MIKCPRCNADMIVDATIILTSYPPQYTLICPECGHTITRQCSECEENKHLYTFDEVNELQKKAHRSEYERGYKDGYNIPALFDCLFAYLRLAAGALALGGLFAYLNFVSCL